MLARIALKQQVYKHSGCFGWKGMAIGMGLDCKSSQITSRNATGVAFLCYVATQNPYQVSNPPILATQMKIKIVTLIGNVVW